RKSGKRARPPFSPAWPRGAPSRRVRRGAGFDENDEIVLLDPAELGARSLVEQIAIEDGATQQRHLALERGALVLEVRVLGAQRKNRALAVTLGFEAAGAFIGRGEEIALHQRRRSPEEGDAQDHAQAVPDDHAGSGPRPVPPA